MYRTIDTNTYDAQLIFGQSEITDSCWLWMGSMYNTVQTGLHESVRPADMKPSLDIAEKED